MKTFASYLACLAAFAVAAGSAAAQSPTPEENREANIKAYISMMRKDLNKDKVAILTEMMDLDSGEAAKFWPIYDEYSKSLAKLGDERIAFIRLYAENYASLSGDMATKIALGMMDVESKRLDLRRQYFQRLSQALSPKDAARWLQIEGQIEKVLDLQILASLPIVD